MKIYFSFFLLHDNSKYVNISLSIFFIKFSTKTLNRFGILDIIILQFMMLPTKKWEVGIKHVMSHVFNYQKISYMKGT